MARIVRLNPLNRLRRIPSRISEALPPPCPSLLESDNLLEHRNTAHPSPYVSCERRYDGRTVRLAKSPSGERNR